MKEKKEGHPAALRIAWIGVIAVMVGGYVLTVEPRDEDVRSAWLRAHELYELANHNERMLQGAAELTSARKRVARDIATLAAQNTSGRAMLAAVQVLGREARARHVVVVALAPEGDATPAPSAESLTVSLRGRYRDVLGTIAVLSTREVLLRIEAAELGQATALPAREIEATLHARLYHGLAEIEKEDVHDQTFVR